MVALLESGTRFESEEPYRRNHRNLLGRVTFLPLTLLVAVQVREKVLYGATLGRRVVLAMRSTVMVGAEKSKRNILLKNRSHQLPSFMTAMLKYKQ